MKKGPGSKTGVALKKGPDRKEYSKKKGRKSIYTLESGKKLRSFPAMGGWNFPWDWEKAALFLVALLLFYPPYFRGLFFAPEQEWTLLLALIPLGLVWFLKWRERDPVFLASPQEWCAFLLVILYGAACFWAADKKLAVDGFVKYSLYFLIFWQVAHLARTEKARGVLMHSLYLTAVGVAAAGFLTAVQVVHIKDGFVGGRIYSTLQYPNALASFLAGGSFLGFYLRSRAKAELKLMYALGNYILVLIFLCTGSRGAYVVYPLALLLWVVMLPREARAENVIHLIFTVIAALVGVHDLIPAAVEGAFQRAWISLVLGAAAAVLFEGVILAKAKGVFRSVHVPSRIVVLAVLLVIVAGIGVAVARAGQDDRSLDQMVEKLLPENIASRIRDIGLETKSARERIYWTLDAAKIIRDYPLLGAGGGGWEANYRRYQGYGYNSTKVHNDWVELTVEVGTLGLILFVAVWFFFLRAAWRSYKRGAVPERAETVALAVGGISLGLHAAVDFDLALGAVSIMLWAIFGLMRGKERELAGKAQVKEGLFDRRFRWNLAGSVAFALIPGVLAFLLFSGDSFAREGVRELRAANYGRARELFERAVKLDPVSSDYRLDLASIYLGQGNPEALGLADQAVRRSRSDWRVRSSAGEIYLAAGELDRAAREFESARDLAPFYRGAWQGYARGMAVVGINVLSREGLDKARPYLEKAAAAADEMASRVRDLGEEEQRNWAGKDEFASDGAVHLWSGAGCYFLGQWEQAEQKWTVAEKDPAAKGEVLAWKAVLEHKRGREAKAESLLAQARELGSSTAESFDFLAELPVAGR